jgi:hypothetical protein
MPVNPALYLDSFCYVFIDALEGNAPFSGKNCRVENFSLASATCRRRCLPGRVAQWDILLNELVLVEVFSVPQCSWEWSLQPL